MARPEQEPSNRIELQTPEGLSATISQKGAYLERLVDPSGNDLLFPRQQIGAKDRGGIPICAPIFGPGDSFGLEQHGFARNLVWENIDYTRPNSVWFELVNPRSQDESIPDEYAGCRLRAGFGLDSVASSSVLNLFFEVHNDGEQPFYAAPGFHPYFPVPANQTADQVFIQKDSLNLQFSHRELINSAKLPPLKKSGISFDLDGYNVDISSPEMGYTVIWSENPDKYICIEPTVAGSIAGVNDRDIQEFLLFPGQVSYYSMMIDWEKK